jgi:moderate conductance mechanosensitive channel
MIETVQEYVLSVAWETLTLTGLRIIVMLLVAWIALKLLQRSLHRLEKRLIVKSVHEGEPPSESQKRIETIVRLVKQGLQLAILVTFGLVILKEIGVEVTPILASAGVVGLAVGFGAQNLVRDVIAGFFIILENQIRVGDVAIVNGTGGLVEHINFRTTILRDLAGVVHVFPNGSITSLSNLTTEWSAYVFEIGVAYKEDTDHVIEIMKNVGKTMLEDQQYRQYMLEAPDIFGIEKFADSAVIIKGRIKTKPIRQWEVGREFLRRIKYAFDENSIEIPVPHRSIFFDETTKAFDVHLFDKMKNDQPSGESHRVRS